MSSAAKGPRSASSPDLVSSHLLPAQLGQASRTHPHRRAEPVAVHACGSGGFGAMLRAI
jgi:hypothetical protein